jgi:hypothetical protein
MVFVNLDEKGEPAPHGRTKVRFADEAFQRYLESAQAFEAMTPPTSF